ncbi:unnamed protein product [Amoebophrya sp. A25]|nr:unnamed protein product [Amoebophrya sp. A25]|eukprot:GSA25T00003718001.1
MPAVPSSTRSREDSAPCDVSTSKRRAGLADVPLSDSPAEQPASKKLEKCFRGTESIVSNAEPPRNAESKKSFLSSQWFLLREMWRRKDLFVPMLAIWSASFGGALHEPVTTFFLLQLGASTAELGNFGAITTFGGIFATPVYGYLMDKGEKKYTFLACCFSAACCAFGCLIRGLAPPVVTPEVDLSGHVTSVSDSANLSIEPALAAPGFGGKEPLRDEVRLLGSWITGESPEDLVEDMRRFLPPTTTTAARELGATSMSSMPTLSSSRNKLSSGAFPLYLAHIVMGLGAVNFWNVVGSYVALAMPRDLRSLTVSGFQVQVASLKLLGTSLYPAFDTTLQTIEADGLGLNTKEDRLLRDRIHMSVCSIFCVFGFFYMLFCFRPVDIGGEAEEKTKRNREKAIELEVAQEQDNVVKDTGKEVTSGKEVRTREKSNVEQGLVQYEEGPLFTTSPFAATSTTTAATTIESTAISEPDNPGNDNAKPNYQDDHRPTTTSTNSPRHTSRLRLRIVLSLLCVGMVVQAFGETVARVLWPLHVREQFGWDSHELAYLQLGSQVAVILATVSYPPLVSSLGRKCTASALPLFAGFTLLTAFLQPAQLVLLSTHLQEDVESQNLLFPFRETFSAKQLCSMLHTVNVLLFLAASAILKVCFQHVATLAAPPAYQGRLFSALAVLSSIGTILGNLVGTRWSSAHQGDSLLLADAPFLLSAGLFVVIGAANGWLLTRNIGSD